jgi:hypothetical protein
MNDEWAAARVATDVLDHLERRREALAGDGAAVRRELEAALVPLRAAYAESSLPAPFFTALEEELRQVLPERWQAAAARFTALEGRGFGSWRGGDVYARIAYVFAGLTVGGLCVEAPFIPIWEKWFPFALGLVAWWLPDVQALWHRRRYARELGRIVGAVSARQAAMEAQVSLKELASPDADGQSRDPR